MAELRYDTMFAAQYDERWGRVDPTHARMVARFLELCGEGAAILDAACGTGKYWEMVLARGCRVVGVDQSVQMLRRATEKFPGVPVRKLALQELDFHREFAAVGVRTWLEEAGFTVMEEASGDGYDHFLARKHSLMGGRTGEG